jgi:hypothetical protein
LKYDLYHYPFTLSALLYAEGFTNFLYGFSGSFQLLNGIFYLDYLYNSFAKNSSLVFGLRYNMPWAVALNYEYFYNGSGFSADDSNWLKHNMFLSLMWNPSFLPSLTFGSQFQLSAPSLIDTKDMGLELIPYLGYSFYQNLSADLSMSFPVVGASGSFKIMLELKFKY